MARRLPRIPLIAITSVAWQNRLPRREWCACLDPRPPQEALRDLTDELTELRTELVELVTPIRRFIVSLVSSAPHRPVLNNALGAPLDGVLDEVSDVSFALGRLAGGVLKLRFLPTPYARRHIDKVVARMDEHGCVRSPSHLINGRCPLAHQAPSK